MAPLTAEEILAHPEFPYVTWTLAPNRKERVKVGRGRGGPFRIAYEIHGTGPIHMLWIMGLGGIKQAWQRQTKDFGHKQADKYSCLVLDNRGIGESDRPLMRYSTSEMARDIIEVLDHVGWTQERSIHITAVSMGGMIAQELALRISERVASLTLVSTGRRIYNTIGFFENIYNRAMLFVPHHIDDQLNRIKYNLHSEAFVNGPDQTEYVEEPFPTAGDRCMAIELFKRLDQFYYPKHGFLMQLLAAGWHFKSEAQMARLAAQVGPSRIQVIHGTNDNMVTFPHGVELAEALGGEEAGVTVRFIEGQGHVIPIEMRSEFNSWVEALVQKTEAMKKSSAVKEKGVNEHVGNGMLTNGHANGYTNGGAN